MVPKYLYKVLSVENWRESQGKKSVKLSEMDDDFIHFSMEDQLERVIKKFWSDIPEFVVVKIETTKLPGKLLYEANPGGSNKYYHLYDGSIPLNAIVDSKIIRS